MRIVDLTGIRIKLALPEGRLPKNRHGGAVGLFNSHGLFLDLDPFEPFHWEQQLNKDTLDEREGPDGEADEVLVESQRDCSQGGASVLDHQDLDTNCGEDNREEEEVVEEAGEDVELFLAEFSCVDLVEDLDEDEGMEDQGIVSKLVSYILSHLIALTFLVAFVHHSVETLLVIVVVKAENGLPCEEEDEKNNDLINSLAHYVADHDRGHDVVVTWVWLILEQGFIRALGSKRKGSKSFNDQFYP